MTILVASFLIVALSAYALFGGADFGGGILEATLREQKLKTKLQGVLSPIWEANHVWLIAVVVILFVGFPLFYSQAMTRLYVPISLALVGILIRGTAFTLRKYDPAGPSWHKFYSAMFRLSSLGTPLCFGFVVAGLLVVHPGDATSPPPSLHYVDLYIFPWLHPFGFACGVFVSCLFAYLAAVFFYGELSEQDEKDVIATRILGFFVATFFSGGLTLLLGAVSGTVAPSAIGPTHLVSQVAALGASFWLLRAQLRDHAWHMRGAAGVQVLAILGGWFSTQYPALMRFEAGPLTLDEAAAPPITQRWLLIGLVVILAAVIPLLVQLYRVFQNTNRGATTPSS